MKLALIFLIGLTLTIVGIEFVDIWASTLTNTRANVFLVGIVGALMLLPFLVGLGVMAQQMIVGGKS